MSCLKSAGMVLGPMDIEPKRKVLATVSVAKYFERYINNEFDDESSGNAKGKGKDKDTKPAAKPAPKRRRRQEAAQQIPLYGQKSPLLEEMEKLDIDSLTPFEALTKLYELQKRAREGEI